jgi:hypothetical protein
MAFGSLRFRTVRSLMACATVAATVGAIVVTHALTLQQLRRGQALMSHFQERFLLVYESYTTTFSPTLLDAEQAGLKGAGVVAAHRFFLGPFLDDQDPLPVSLCGMPEPEPPEVRRLYRVMEGHAPAPGERAVMLERDYALRRHVKPGDLLGIVAGHPKVAVSGIFERDPSVVTSSVAAPISVVQELRSMGDEVSFLLVELTPGTPPEDAARKISALLPGLQVIPLGVAMGRVAEMLSPLSLAAKTVALLVALLCALVACMTLLSSIHERKQEFATLRCLGFSARFLLAMILAEAVVLGVLGTLLGSVAGVAVTVLVLPMVHPFYGGFPQAQDLLLAGGVGLLASVVGGVLPAVRVAQAQPQGGGRY